MAITHWLVRGDNHGSFVWMSQQLEDYEPETTAIIILGDVGLNFYLNKTDERTKREVEAKGYYLYCVRGNHECRPIRLPNICMTFDENVNVENSLCYAKALSRNKVPYELHIFSFGIHGLSTCDEITNNSVDEKAKRNQIWLDLVF